MALVRRRTEGSHSINEGLTILSFTLLLIFVLWLIDKHGLWRKAFKFVLWTAALGLLALIGLYSWSRYEAHKEQVELKAAAQLDIAAAQAEAAANQAKLEACQLQLLEAEHLRGHVHSAWFKDAMLNRFYAICNCCECCCGGIREMAERGVPTVASSGYVARIDPAACALCDDCIEACPFHAISKNDDTVIHDWERCLGCGVCEVMCKVGAITMVRDERKGVPLDVRMLA